MTKKEQLIKKIQESVPEIMELKFGCKVNLSGYYVTVIRLLESNNYTYNQHTKRKYIGMQKIIEYSENFGVGRTPIGEITKIIGRDITLSDVLLALEVEHKDGCDYEWYRDEIVRLWNKADNNLLNQSEETFNLLYKIFGI